MLECDASTEAVHREIAAKAARWLEWFAQTDNTLQITVECGAGVGVEGYDEAMAYLATAAQSDTEGMLRRALAYARK